MEKLKLILKQRHEGWTIGIGEASDKEEMMSDGWLVSLKKIGRIKLRGTDGSDSFLA